MPIAQERILIIGGSSGMGLAIAQRLSKVGAEVFITGRDQAKLDRALTTLEGPAADVVADFTDADSFGELMTRVGRLDHLVLAAGGGPAWGPFAQVAAQTLRRAIDYKLIGYWQSLQAALPVLRRDGSVVMLTGAALRVAMNDIDGAARTPL